MPSDPNTQPPYSTTDTRLDRAVTQGRLIVMAQVASLLLFSGVAVAVGASNGSLLSGTSPLPALVGGIAIVMLVIGLIVGVVIRHGVESRVRRGEEVAIERITGAVITAAALVQGPALLGAVAGLLGGPSYLLIALVGVAILIVQWMRLPDRMRDMAGAGATYRWR